MNKNFKTSEAYKTISEVAKALDLIDKKTGKPQTHTLRYWETQFKQIRPLIRAGRRRYYSNKNFRVIKLIKFLLKEKGLTINGVKKILSDTDIQNLDVYTNLGVYKLNLKNANIVKEKVKKISKIINDLKKFK